MTQNKIWSKIKGAFAVLKVASIPSEIAKHFIAYAIYEYKA